MKLQALLLVTFLAGCGGGKVTAAPPPLRPTPIPEEVKPPPPQVPTDCEPSSSTDALPFLPYEQRKLSIEEAQEIAKEGIGLINSAKAPGVDQGSSEGFIEAAVAKLITALQVDPYNIDATYNLAAMYAKIDRVQCSINMLERLLQMRDHPSQKVAVEGKLDLLLGRGKVKIDPDFDDDIRSDSRFRELIQRAGVTP